MKFFFFFFLVPFTLLGKLSQLGTYTDLSSGMCYSVTVHYFMGNEVISLTDYENVNLKNAYAAIYWGEGRASLIDLGEWYCGEVFVKDCLPNSPVIGFTQDGYECRINRQIQVDCPQLWNPSYAESKNITSPNYPFPQGSLKKNRKKGKVLKEKRKRKTNDEFDKKYNRVNNRSRKPQKASRIKIDGVGVAILGAFSYVIYRIIDEL